SSGNADASLERRRGLQPSHRLDHIQPGPYGLLSIILMGLGIAKVHEHAVAHILRYEPAKAIHDCGDSHLISCNDLPQGLGVHAGRECSRPDEVREHHRDLTTLGGIERPYGRSSVGRSGSFLSSLPGITERGDRPQDLTTIA